MKDQMDVCPLSRGVIFPSGATPINPITGLLSLVPSSLSRRSIGLPYGWLSHTWENARGCHVPRLYQNDEGPASPPVVLAPALGHPQDPKPTTSLLGQACQHFWLVLFNDVYQRFT